MFLVWKVDSRPYNKEGFVLKKFISIIIIFLLFLTSFNSTLASSSSQTIPDDIRRVVENEYFGRGGLNLENYATRAEFATIAVRFTGIKDEEVKAANGRGPFSDTDSFQGGWAVPHIAMAYNKGLMLGVNDNQFNPGGQVTYIQLLVVMMRLLGYRDGVDFISFPIDHYGKAVEIGLADKSMDINARVTRGLMAKTMERTLDMKMNNQPYTLADYLGVIDSRAPKPKISVTDSYFSTSVIGIFRGQLTGANYFKDYSIEFLSKGSKSARILKKSIVDSDGKFEVSGFDISLISQLSGYKYRLYDGRGDLILEKDL